MSGQAKRILGIAVGTVLLFVGLGLYIGLYLTNASGSVAATTNSSGTHLYLATVPAAELSDALGISGERASPNLAPLLHAHRQVSEPRELSRQTRLIVECPIPRS